MNVTIQRTIGGLEIGFGINAECDVSADVNVTQYPAEREVGLSEGFEYDWSPMGGNDPRIDDIRLYDAENELISHSLGQCPELEQKITNEAIRLFKSEVDFGENDNWKIVDEIADTIEIDKYLAQ